MSKIMEIIEKKPNFKKGECSLTLFETGFGQLSRKVGQKTGANFRNPVTGDPLSKELIKTLNVEQLRLKSKYETLIVKYNSLITEKQKVIPNLEKFVYNFSSLVNYADEIVPFETVADYYLLSKMISAEKELYELGKFWIPRHHERILQQMGEWSKTRPYGNNVEEYRVGTIETRGTSEWGWRRFSSPTYCTATYTSGARDKKYITFTDVDKIPLGSTDWVVYDVGTNTSDGGGSGGSGGSDDKIFTTRADLSTRFRWGIKRYKLDDNDTESGYFKYEIIFERVTNGGSNNAIEKHHGDGGISLKNLPSSHFDLTNDVNLKHIKNRVLI